MANGISGTFVARAKSWGFGKANTGTEQVGVSFEIKEGEHAGTRLTWYGFFNTEENAKRAISAMEKCGWDKSGPITEAAGLDKNDVEIVVEEEEYNGNFTSKVKWVNAIGPALKPMTDEQKASLNSRAAKWLSSSGAKSGGTGNRPPPRNQPASRPNTGSSGGAVSWDSGSQQSGEDEIPF